MDTFAIAVPTLWAKAGPDPVQATAPLRLNTTTGPTIRKRGYGYSVELVSKTAPAGIRRAPSGAKTRIFVGSGRRG